MVLAKHIGLGNTYSKHYADIFVNFADDKDNVQPFNDMQLSYIGDSHVDTLVSIKYNETDVKNVKSDKAAGAYGIVFEHIIQSLVSLCTWNYYSTSWFCTSIIVPIVEDK